MFPIFTLDLQINKNTNPVKKNRSQNPITTTKRPSSISFSISILSCSI